MSSKKFKPQYPIDSTHVNNNFKISMSHKKDMSGIKTKNSKTFDSIVNKDRKKSFTMAHRDFNKVPEKVEVVFAKNNEFIDLIRKTIKEVDKDVDTSKVWEKFKQDLIDFEEGKSEESFECLPEELYNMLFKFYSKIENFQDKLFIALEEIEIMNDILTLVQEYEKQNKK